MPRYKSTSALGAVSAQPAEVAYSVLNMHVLNRSRTFPTPIP